MANLQSDDFFGEMALISNEPRNATITAEEVTELFILQRYDFDKILMKNPVIAQELKKSYFERKLQERIKALTEGGLTAENINKDGAVKKLRADLRKSDIRLRAIGAKEKLNQQLAEAKRQKEEEKAEQSKEKEKKGKKAEAEAAVSKRQQKKKDKLAGKEKKKEQPEGQAPAQE